MWSSEIGIRYVEILPHEIASLQTGFEQGGELWIQIQNLLKNFVPPPRAKPETLLDAVVIMDINMPEFRYESLKYQKRENQQNFSLQKVL